MRRRRPIAIATAAALATICAGAAAKEIDTVSICGADGCRAVTDERLLALLAEGGPRHHGAVAPAEHFVARVRIVHRGAGAYGFKTTVLPAAGLVRGDDGTWMELPRAAQDAYEKLTRGRDPLPASAMSGGSVVDPPPAAARPAATAASGDGSDGLPWPWLAAAAAVALSAAAVRRARRRPAST
jgi:hypothetical protein